MTFWVSVFHSQATVVSQYPPPSPDLSFNTRPIQQTEPAFHQPTPHQQPQPTLNQTPRHTDSQIISAYYIFTSTATTFHILINVITNPPQPHHSVHTLDSIPPTPIVTETFSVDEVDTPSPLPKDQPATSQSISQDELFETKAKASSSRNFAAQLTHHLFKPEEPQNRNVRGVGGKLPLDPERINMIKDAVFKFYAAPSSGRDSQWRDCTVAIDSFLRSLK